MTLQGRQIGDYRLLRLISSDGIIETYFADIPRKGQQATIKVIRTDFTSNDGYIKEAAHRFLSEATTIAQLNHPNILPLSGAGESNINGVNLPYIIIPLRKEDDLAQWLQQRRTSRLPQKEVAYIVHQAAAALQYTHDKGIIHQDVKPSNFLVCGNPDNPNYPQLLLTGFVLSTSPSATGLPQNAHGTPTYMAPEQWKGQPVPASDQYELAVMAYELLTGRPPFQGDVMGLMNQHLNIEPQPPSTLNQQLSKDIDFVLLHSLAKMPERRFASISAFDLAFQNATQESEVILSQEPPAALDKQSQMASQNKTKETSLPTLIARPARPSPLTILLVAVAVLVTIGSSIVYYLGIYRPNQSYAQTTATVLANITNTARVNTRATTTAQTVTAFQDNFDQITSSAPSFNDAMTNPNDNKWDNSISGRGGCNFTNGAYHVTLKLKARTFPCYARGTNFGDFVYQVQMQITQGDYGGLLFRSDLTTGVGYAFFVGADGTYKLVAYPGSGNQPKVLVSGININIPIVRGQAYQVAVVAQGNNFDLFINGSYIGSTHDSKANSASGVLGLTAGTINASSSDVAYTQVQVWKL
jgi:serine/threonine protein kinase